MNAVPGTWVLLRGLAREARHWEDFPAHVQQAFPDARILAPDLPGNGLRCAERSPANVPDMVEAYRDTIRGELGNAPFGLIGLSLGGMIAAEWALRHPAEVAAAVLINSSARPTGQVWQRLRPRVWPLVVHFMWGSSFEMRERAALRMTSTRRTEDADLIARWAAHARECPMTRVNRMRQLLAATRFRLPPAPPPAPVLVLASATDGMVDPACSQALAEAWHTDFALHPVAGHDLPLDDPAWVANTVRDWCARRFTA